MDHLNAWLLRKERDVFDPKKTYGKSTTRFTLELHHGGFFTMGSGRRYMNGKVSWVDGVDIDVFSVIDLKDMFTKLGYKEEDTMYFHFRIPNRDLDSGLMPLACDSDVLSLAKYVGKCKVIEVYLELWLSSLDIAQKSGNKQKVTFDELLTEFDMSHDFDPFFTSGDVTGQSSEVHVELGQSSGNKNQEDEDSDFMEFDENPINDVEVNMNEFRDNIDKNVESVGGSEAEVGNDVECSDVEELDHEYFDSATDEEGDIEVERNQALRKISKKERSLAIMSSEWNFHLGKKIASKELIKKMVSRLAVEERRQLHLDRNDKKKVRVICRGKRPVFSESNELVMYAKDGPVKKTNEATGPDNGPIIDSKQVCPWLLHISKGPHDESWVVKTYKNTHKCLQTREVKKCTASFLAKDVEESIVPNPKIPTTAIRDQLQKKYHLGVSKMKAYRAKKIAKDKVFGDFADQYSQLKTYASELQKANPDTTVKLEVVRDNIDIKSNTRQFKRIYICLGALKKGFKHGNRDLLGLDGCFLSGPWPGQILTAVGVDPNNGTYPVAYAIVESETKDSWMWFLDCLGDDLHLNQRSNFTFISDRQKGIIPALATVFPSVEHRFCLKHIYDNMKQQWRGELYKDLLWKCATATTPQAFERHIAELQTESKDAYLWLKKIDPCHWSRSHFSGRAKCDVLLNNICEVLNRQLLDGRDKPIITCLEFIREYLMKKIVNVQKVIDNSDGPLTPNASRLFKAIKEDSSKYRVTWNGGQKYQVNGPWGEQCVVDISTKTCSCRKWEITGMPCKHSVAAINDMGNNGMEVGLPEAWVKSCYWLSTWKKMYSFKINPVGSPEFWSNSSVPIILSPPDYHTPIGRPPKKRKMSAFELSDKMSKNGKLSRAGKSVTCQICKQLGHNKRSCKLKDSATPIKKHNKRSSKQASDSPRSPTPRPSQGIIIRDSPSANTRSSQAAKLSQEAAKSKGKGRLVE